MNKIVQRFPHPLCKGDFTSPARISKERHGTLETSFCFKIVMVTEHLTPFNCTEHNSRVVKKKKKKGRILRVAFTTTVLVIFGTSENSNIFFFLNMELGQKVSVEKCATVGLKGVHYLILHFCASVRS